VRRQGRERVDALDVERELVEYAARTSTDAPTGFADRLVAAVMATETSARRRRGLAWLPRWLTSPLAPVGTIGLRFGAAIALLLASALVAAAAVLPLAHRPPVDPPSTPGRSLPTFLTASPTPVAPRLDRPAATASVHETIDERPSASISPRPTHAARRHVTDETPSPTSHPRGSSGDDEDDGHDDGGSGGSGNRGPDASDDDGDRGDDHDGPDGSTRPSASPSDEEGSSGDDDEDHHDESGDRSGQDGR